MASSNSQSETSQQQNGLLHWLKANFWTIVTLVVAFIASLMIVHALKKPGQMSVVESQAMDMSAMVPPKGAVPVAIARAKVAELAGSVTYTGTAQAYEDEDIYPRITGRIVSMPVYPGDKVSKGQLLVLLDPEANSEYFQRFEEARYASEAAEHDAGIAKQEFKQKQYELKAAEKAVQAAAGAVDEAKANLEYWEPEVKRELALLKRQVISQQEFDSENSQYKSAQAKVAQAQDKLAEATNRKIAVEAEFEAALHHIGHRHAMAEQADASTRAARIIDSYRRIVAGGDGVVTKRLISPGVVVNPGMMILKLAHVKRMRLQAEIASEDAAKIQVGDAVYFKTSEDLDERQAEVTSIFPAADPASRTFIVEALIENMVPLGSRNSSRRVTARIENLKTLAQYRFLPGQYVIMRILTGETTALTIPTRAIVWREGHPQVWQAIGASSGPVRYTCLMHPEVISDKPGNCPKCGMNLVVKEPGGGLTAQLVDIKTGLSNEQKTEVRSGLKEGDLVIYEGQSDLRPGIQVVATSWTRSGPAKLPTASEVTSNRLGSSNNWAAQQVVANLMVKVSISSPPPKSGSNSLLVTLTDHGGSTIAGASITGKTSMPTMNMPGPDVSASSNGNGDYVVKTDFTSGLWALKLSVAAPNQAPAELAFEIEVP